MHSPVLSRFSDCLRWDARLGLVIVPCILNNCLGIVEQSGCPFPCSKTKCHNSQCKPVRCSNHELHMRFRKCTSVTCMGTVFPYQLLWRSNDGGTPLLEVVHLVSFIEYCNTTCIKGSTVIFSVYNQNIIFHFFMSFFKHFFVHAMPVMRRTNR